MWHVVSATCVPLEAPLAKHPFSFCSCHTQRDASELLAPTHHRGAEAAGRGTGRGADSGHRVLLARLHAHQSLQRLLRLDTDLVPAHQGGDAAVARAQDGTPWGDEQTGLGHCQRGAASGVQVRLPHQGRGLQCVPGVPQGLVPLRVPEHGCARQVPGAVGAQVLGRCELHLRLSLHPELHHRHQLR